MATTEKIGALKHLWVREVVVGAQPGVALDDAICEALQLACREWVDVRLYHNKQDPYVVRIKDVRACVKPAGSGEDVT